MRKNFGFVLVLSCGLAPSVELRAQTDLLRLKGVWADATSSPVVTAARYHILLEQSGGERVRVPANREFRSGERFWLDLEVRNPAFVYVINRTLTGPRSSVGTNSSPSPVEYNRHLVFGPERIEPGRLVTVPKLPRAMRLDEVTGVEKLYVILSRTRIQELEQNFDSKGAPLATSDAASRSLDCLFAAWAANTDSALPEPNAKGAVLDIDGYSLSRRNDRPLVVELTLAHTR